MEEIGLDAVVFIRFLRMIRGIFHILTIFGCGILIRSMWLAATISMISGICGDFNEVHAAVCFGLKS